MLRKPFLHALILLGAISHSQASLRATKRRQTARRLSDSVTKTLNTSVEILLPYDPQFDCDDAELGISLDICFENGAEMLEQIIATTPGVSFTGGSIETVLNETVPTPEADGFSRRRYRSRGYSSATMSNPSNNDGFVLPTDPADGALSMIPETLPAAIEALEAEHRAEIANLTDAEQELISVHHEEYAAFKANWTVERDELIASWHTMTQNHYKQRSDLMAQLPPLTFDEVNAAREELIAQQMAERDAWVAKRDVLITNYLDDYQAMYTRQQVQLGAAEESLKLLLARHEAEIIELKKQYSDDLSMLEDTNDLAFLIGQLSDDEFIMVLDRYELELESLCTAEVKDLQCWPSAEDPLVSIELTPIE